MESLSWSLPGLELTDHTIEVPLDHAAPDGESITVFARVVTRPGGEDLPYLVYLQGGPGSEAPRPDGTAQPSWLPSALEHHRVVMLDQRGTGRSTPIGPSLLEDRSAEQAARYLTRFRADAIVRDAEILRAELGGEPWTLLGQSFGGFTALRYLSAHSEGVASAMFTGGLPRLGPEIDEIYRVTWEGMARRSEKYWAEFPADRDRFRALADRAADGRLRLLDGQTVGVERLRRLGHLLGASGGYEKLHYLLDLPADSPAFLSDLASALPFGARNPIYAVLQESCWADATATRWAAERTQPQAVREDPTLLAGEHIHHEALTEDPLLAPWAEVAEILAEHEWPALYGQASLRTVEVPVAAAVYFEDAYVPREFSLATADVLPQATCWVTSEYEHNGLRASGTGVFDHLHEIIRGTRRA
jgi:pimeloyl-ACP methyl ester carboxylesterase